MKNILYEIKRIPGKGIEWKDGQKDFICSLYLQNVSISQLEKDFGGLHYETIKKVLKENNIKLRTRSQSKMKYTRISDIFNQINTHDKAYWLGVLASDGFVGREKDGTGTNMVRLNMKDKDVIEKFKLFLNTNQEIKYIESSKTWDLSFQDKEMAIDLVEKGIFNHKSLVLKPPKIEKELEYDYIRGYFDGDGGVNVNLANNRIQMYFTGTYEVLQWIKEHLKTEAKIFKEHRCLNNTYRLQINGTNYCKYNFDLLYKFSTSNSRMNRKYNIFYNYFNGRFNE